MLGLKTLYLDRTTAQRGLGSTAMFLAAVGADRTPSAKVLSQLWNYDVSFTLCLPWANRFCHGQNLPEVNCIKQADVQEAPFDDSPISMTFTRTCSNWWFRELTCLRCLGAWGHDATRRPSVQISWAGSKRLAMGCKRRSCHAGALEKRLCFESNSANAFMLSLCLPPACVSCPQASADYLCCRIYRSLRTWKYQFASWVSEHWWKNVHACAWHRSWRFDRQESPKNSCLPGCLHVVLIRFVSNSFKVFKATRSFFILLQELHIVFSRGPHS